MEKFLIGIDWIDITIICLGWLFIGLLVGYIFVQLLFFFEDYRIEHKEMYEFYKKYRDKPIEVKFQERRKK